MARAERLRNTALGGHGARYSASGSHDGPVTVIEPRSNGVRARLGEVWAYRGLLGYFGRRYLEKRYIRTWLGRPWLVLRPLLTVGSQALVFGAVLGVASGDVPYLVFFLVAVGAWQLFAQTAYWATRSLELNRRVLRRTYAPRLILIGAAAIPSFVEYVIYAAMAAVVVGYYTVVDADFPLVLGLQTLLAPVGLLALVLLALGIGLWTSVYGLEARDVRFGLTYVLSFWYFLTPVIYPLDAISERYRVVAGLNPATAPIEMVKEGLLDAGQIGAVAVASSVVTILVLVTSGLWFFERSESRALDGV